MKNKKELKGQPGQIQKELVTALSITASRWRLWKRCVSRATQYARCLQPAFYIRPHSGAHPRLLLTPTLMRDTPSPLSPRLTCPNPAGETTTAIQVHSFASWGRARPPPLWAEGWRGGGHRGRGAMDIRMSIDMYVKRFVNRYSHVYARIY